MSKRQCRDSRGSSVTFNFPPEGGEFIFSADTRVTFRPHNSSSEARQVYPVVGRSTNASSSTPPMASGNIERENQPPVQPLAEPAVPVIKPDNQRPSGLKASGVHLRSSTPSNRVISPLETGNTPEEAIQVDSDNDLSDSDSASTTAQRRRRRRRYLQLTSFMQPSSQVLAETRPETSRTGAASADAALHTLTDTEHSPFRWTPEQDRKFAEGWKQYCIQAILARDFVPPRSRQACGRRVRQLEQEGFLKEMTVEGVKERIVLLPN
jgi:hypothetical protein